MHAADTENAFRLIEPRQHRHLDEYVWFYPDIVPNLNEIAKS